VFSLEYTVEQPITTVFKRSAMDQYRQLFQFLWKLKRVEHTLSNGWRRQMTSVHTLRQAESKLFTLYRSSIIASILITFICNIELEKELRYCNIQCSEMVHFIYQLQYYILFEVSNMLNPNTSTY
jgi:gamma-tubulin complex component 3